MSHFADIFHNFDPAVLHNFIGLNYYFFAVDGLENFASKIVR